MPAVAPSPGWTRNNIAILVVLLVVTNAVTAATVIILVSQPDDPRLLVPTKTIKYFAPLDTGQREVTVSSQDAKGPFVLESSSEGQVPEDCRLAVNDEEVHKSRCSSFRFEYLLQARAGIRITFEFTASIGIQDTASSLEITLEIEQGAKIDVVGDLVTVPQPGVGALSAFGFASSERGPYREIVHEPYNLTSGASQGFHGEARGWVWINITASVEVTYEIQINQKIVITGGCAGGVVNAYVWIEERVKFSVDVDITATGAPADGSVVIEGMTE